MEQVKEQEGLASAGTFCPKKECRHYAKVDEGNLIKFGRSRQGVQRYQCKSCGTTFTATRGTFFYRKHTPLKDILETLALLAEGVGISSLSRAKGFNPARRAPALNFPAASGPLSMVRSPRRRSSSPGSGCGR